MGHCGMSVLVGDGPNSKNPAPFSDFFLIAVPWHMEIPRPGIEAEPELQLMP